MNHTIRLVSSFCLASVLGCFVPSVEELAETHPVTRYACTEQYSKCPEGKTCVEGTCLDTLSLTCVPGATQACGHSLGVCVTGLQTCASNATWDPTCKGEVAPTVEVCGDKKDNDCNGLEDAFRVSSLTEKSTLNPGVASAFLSESGTLLLATVEEDALVIRARGADGELRELGRHSSTRRYRIQLPRLAADANQAVVGWVEVAPLGEAGKPEVFLAKLDPNRVPTAKFIPIHIPYTAPGEEENYVTDLAVAINASHFLVVNTTSALAPGDTTTETRKTWASTLQRNLQEPVTRGTRYIAAPKRQFGLFATANGSRDMFLVAFENGGAYKSYSFTNEAASFELAYLNEVEDSHSPFIVPTPDDAFSHRLFYVRRTPQKNSSEITFVKCTVASDECPPGATQPLYTSSYAIRRAQMMLPGGAPDPRYALVSTFDVVTKTETLSVVNLGGGGPSEPLQVAEGSVAETVVSAPVRDMLHHVVYFQRPDPTRLELKASFQSFCLP